MMVERSPYVENVRQLATDLNQATTKLNKLSKEKQTVSNQEITDLITVLHEINTHIDPSFLDEKKLVPEDMNDNIEKALAAVQLFQRNQPIKAVEAGAQKNVQQAIASLFYALSREINDFDKNLRSLKELKIGRKVEQTNRSKQS